MPRPTNRGRSWLTPWLDEHGIRSGEELSKLWSSRQRRHEFRALLDAVPFAPPAADPGASAPIAAGAGLDLSASMGGCLDPACLKSDVDRLVGRTWHYFDRVMVVGPSAHTLAAVFDRDQGRALSHLRGYAEMLTHIREIGAEDYLAFGEKRPPCMEHLPQHAADAGMGALLDDTDRWVERLRADADCEVRHSGPKDGCQAEHWSYALNHPWLEHTRWGDVHSPRDAVAADVVRLVLADVYRNAIAHLTSDAQFARATGAALGAGAALHEEFLEEAPKARPSVLEIAYDLPLPVLTGISAKQLLQLREAEGASYEVFRQAVRTAIKERLKEEDGTAAAAAIAIEVAEDVIEPALAKIRNDLEGATRLLRRTTQLTAGVGILVTTVGLLAGAPVVIGPLVGAAVGGADLKRYFADRSEVETSEMYFLWRVLERAHSEHG